MRHLPDPRENASPEGAGFETICEHHGENALAHGGGAVPPLYQNSTFVFPDAESFERRHDPGAHIFEYTRHDNPTTAILEAKWARLESGNWARCFSSGMGAISAALGGCLKAGDHVVCVYRCYWPTKQLLNHWRRFNIETTFVKGVEPADFVAALRPETKVLYLESPTAGLGDVPPVEPLTKLASERGITTIFDNSWATPYFLKPLELGCDLVVHSATKFFGGHSDVVAGAVMGRDAQLEERVTQERILVGAVPDPFAAWLLLRGLRTLPIRMERHQASALAVAQLLVDHPKIDRVYHPGLPDHPHHEIARRQLRGYGSLFAFTLKEQTREACYRVINKLKLFQIGVSWGGHESLVVGGNFFSDDPEHIVWIVRLHVGLETVDDLLADVTQALED
ncbi:MAG: aminotransferase class I/II-fold pyridoxal phosphate-dependent enzyme [Phycisphaerae bacterium]|nr:aminotransferase class I/II-fold pyridoxal phosphate-dependent enzyme [Phycisphaerae bacterium]